MKRLTSKTDDKRYPYKYLDIDDCIVGTPINKLGQLEDKEEELGIELTLLVDAMSSGIYYIEYNGQISYFHHTEYCLLQGKFGYGSIYDPLFIYFENYGKKEPGGWALTKEELE